MRVPVRCPFLTIVPHLWDSRRCYDARVHPQTWFGNRAPAMSATLVLVLCPRMGVVLGVVDEPKQLERKCIHVLYIHIYIYIYVLPASLRACHPRNHLTRFTSIPDCFPNKKKKTLQSFEEVDSSFSRSLSLMSSAPWATTVGPNCIRSVRE